MRILKEAIWCLSTFLVISCESRPISLHNYAPAHEYKPTDYSFSYGVKDLHTGDVKNQWERKSGNVVKGQYSLLEPDGSTRTVEYTADDKNGFNAIVKYNQHSIHPITVSKEATSHNDIQFNAGHQSSVAYNLYNNIGGLGDKYPKSHAEVQSVVQHEYKIPKSYSEIHTSVAGNLAENADGHQEENQELVKATYVYVPKQQEEAGSEDEDKVSQEEALAEEEAAKNYYSYNSDQSQSQLQEKNENQGQSDVDAEYSVTNIQTHLPLNLNALPNSANKVPIDVSLLNPISIDFTQILKQEQQNSEQNEEPTTPETHVRYSIKDNSVQPSHQLTPEEVEAFLEDFKNNKLSEPVFETGFLPITSKPNHLITQPMLPNTYKSNLKVNSTPGLKHYSSRGNSKFRRNKYEGFSYGQKLLPLFYPPGELRKDTHRSEYARLHRSAPNRNPFVRYAKHIRFLD